MRNPMTVAAVLLITLGMSYTAAAAPRTSGNGCQAQALGDLKRLSPRGYAIYTAMKDKQQFLTWLTCDDLQLGLATSVHESVHVLTEQHDAFPLINGGQVRRPHQVSKFFAPKEIAGNFKSDSYVENYLQPGHATSADDFLYILDELNAYSHDLNSAVKLVPLQRTDRTIDHRDGITALMAFVTSYADTAQKKKPTTWQGLQSPDVKQVVRSLWGQAETVLNASCGIPNIGRNDRTFIAFISDPKRNSALTELLGRAPAVSRECASPEYTSTVTRR